MLSPISSIINSVNRTDRPLNILCAPTHESYETNLAKTGHTFYAYHAEGIKTWGTEYRECPSNYICLDGTKGINQIPSWVDFDLVLSQNKFGQFQVLAPIARHLQLPLISLEHTLPFPMWQHEKKEACRHMRGDTDVFISDYSIDEWKFERDENVQVIKHCVDPIFIPSDIEKQPHILSVVNDWVSRNWCCNFEGWQRITQGLPTKVLGDTPGLSQPAPSLDLLVQEYQSAQVFLNTSTISPVPSVLLEAMSCGCAVVTTATCMIPEIIEHGVNGLISNDETELRGYCEDLLKDESLRIKLGKAARDTVVSQFNIERFTKEWNEVFHNVL